MGRHARQEQGEGSSSHGHATMYLMEGFRDAMELETLICQSSDGLPQKES